MPISSKKTSIRISLTDHLREALDNIKRLKYPYMKDDELFKLGFSQLFARDMILANQRTSVSTILIKLRNIDPGFGKEWIEKNGLDEQNLSEDDLCRMIIDQKNRNNIITKQ